MPTRWAGVGAAMIFCLAILTTARAEVRTYPAPEGEAVAGVYTVTVDGEPVDVYSAMSEFFDGDYYFASFDFSGPVTVEVTSQFPLAQTAILPERFGIRPKLDGERLSFEANAPFRVSVEPNGRVKPLLLFGNEIETDAPDPNDPNVVYFAPGVHRPGKISLADNQTLYLAGGAVVKGSVFATGKNVVVRGRGILAGEESPRFKGPGRYLIDLQDCSNATVRDIIVRNPWSWTAVTRNCDGVRIDNLKICGSRMINDDALDLTNTQNAVVRRCFFRTQDDSVAIKGVSNTPRPCENILIEDCQFWTDSANIFRIGYECETEGMRKITANRIDVLHYSRVSRPPTEYWANAIIWLQPNQNMVMEQCRFDDLVVHCDGSDIIMLMAKPMRCKYGEFQDTEPGSLNGVELKNIRVVGERGDFHGLLYLLGDGPKHDVRDVRFERIDYFGEPVTEKSPCVEIGPFVEGVTFR